MAVTFLDYTTPIRLHYESEIEKSKRITACAKEMSLLNGGMSLCLFALGAIRTISARATVRSIAARSARHELATAARRNIEDDRPWTNASSPRFT